MRIAALTLGLVLSACSTSAGAIETGRPSPATTIPARTTPRVTTEATLDCTVSWVDHFTSIEQISAKAETIVRAVALSSDTVQLKAFAAGNVASLRDARRTTFRVVESVKGTPPAEIRVLEDVCPNLSVRPGEEWVSGKVSGPFFRFADLVHSYEGATIDEVMRDVRAAVR